MARIFLSYRREDSAGYAGRLYDRLRQHFGDGNLFMDVDHIDLGQDFVEIIQKAVSSCDVLLAIIGRQWLHSTDAAGQRRLDNPEDFVRLEITTALKRNIRVIPILVGNASMPRSSDLPEELRPLTRRNALMIGDRFHPDVDRLITSLDAILTASTPPPYVLDQRGEQVIALPPSFTNCIGMEFVLIPAGAFMMGTPREELDAIAGDDRAYREWIETETPQHRATISKLFYMGKYEVTQAQWKAVMGTTIQEQRDKTDKTSELYGVGDDHPMYYVSWSEAQEFMQKLNQMEGKEIYRLPTEAEWEYTARAGTTTRYSFGAAAAALNHHAWYADNSEGETHAVGQKVPNAWGLYDMHGNVWEWVQDWFDEVYYRNSPTVDPQGPDTGAYRVVRGGSWYDPARSAGSAYHGGCVPDVRSGSIGFRCLISS